MKKKDLNNLNTKSTNELNKSLNKKKLKLRSELAEFYAKNDNNPKKLRELKKEIAQILTILRQKEIESEYAKEENEVSKDNN
jgi:ribosomal protein L29